MVSIFNRCSLVAIDVTNPAAVTSFCSIRRRPFRSQDVAATRATLGHQVSEEEWEGPSITSVPNQEETDSYFDRSVRCSDREASLQLQRDSIEIHRVQWVTVGATVENVEHIVAPSAPPAIKKLQPKP
jgi:hypothetical protein